MIGFRRARALTPLLAAALVTLLMLAGQAVAHNGSHGDDDGPAGTIASYDSDTGNLTIDLAKGGSISGVVTSRTWIDDDHNCDDDHGDASKAKARTARHGDWCHERHSLHHGWHDNGDQSDLVIGAEVEDAILILKDGRAWYAKVELED